MPLIKHPVGGTRVPDASRPGEYYEWPHDGAVIEVDLETAAQLGPIAVFTEVPADHPDAPAPSDDDDAQGAGVEYSKEFHGGTFHGEHVNHDGAFTEAPNEGTPEETGDGDEPADAADSGQQADSAHLGDEKRPKKSSTRKGSRTVRE